MENYFYEDENKTIIKSSLLTDEAQKIADSFVKSKEKLSSSQLRKFYNEVKSLENKIEIEGKDFSIVFPLIKMLKSKLEYASNPKKSGRIPKEFKNFMSDCIDEIKDCEDFKAFKLHFEAVVGYYYGKGVRE